MKVPHSRGGRRIAGALTIWFLVSGACATAPPAPAPVVTSAQKMTWMLQLEDQRILKLEAPPPSVEPTPTRRRAPVMPPPTSEPDLTVLVKDADPRIRRRAALAIGRVGLPDGITALTATLADTDPDVRAMAAFGLGLIGESSAEAALVPLLTDPAPLVRGRAAEALGQIGAKGAAEAIGRMAAEYARSTAVTDMAPDDEVWPGPAEAQAFKLGLFALVRLQAYDALAAAVLDGGRPVTPWWPVAFALQRIGDRRAAPVLLELLESTGRYTRAFAARGLGAAKEAAAADRLRAWIDPQNDATLEMKASAIRALAQMGDTRAAGPLVNLAWDSTANPNLRLEAVAALGALRVSETLEPVQDLLTDRWPAMRAAAMRAAARIDRQGFLFVLSGLEPDEDWRVRAALADVLGEIEAKVALPRLHSMLGDQDKRVIPAVLNALSGLKATDIRDILTRHLGDPDFGVRAAAARALGRLKPDGGAAALEEAYERALPDSTYTARAAALEALSQYGLAEAGETLRKALNDKDWPVRIRAAELLAMADPAADPAMTIRPGPSTPVVPYDDPQLGDPTYSPHVFIETAKGTIELELAVLDAPQTARNFVALARKGFFNGLEVHRVVANFVVQDGDPRGDGQGGPGYTIRDELNDRPYLRGTVGMALAWRDTGGSQFFIAHSPQPHLDADYTVFAHVVQGMDVVDRIAPGDVIERVRVWDGTSWQ